ncbi:MAG: 4Fe-4S dicluster domain-containing protein [Desulfatibacillum sp.]|nr:4Fe-4S dicluster domain-containing protein [Desulfatibacillum sp.]
MKFFGKNNDPDLSWDKNAQDALKKAPVMVRSLVRNKVEQMVRDQGGDKVCLADFQLAEQKYRNMLSGKAMDSMKGKMPTPNEPGAPMVVFSSCHNALAGCQNPLIDTEEWIQAIRDWSEVEGISEKLREKVKADTIKFHNKLKISVSGCPNGCSRPQVSDLAVVGFSKPVFELEECVGCGDCAESCPDHAIIMEDERPVRDDAKCQGCFNCTQACPAGCITLSSRGGRLMAGGKLGRHPHLADTVGEYASPREVMPVIDKIVQAFLEKGREDERFADFWIRWNRRG